MACCIQTQISEGVRENLYRQNAVHPVKIYSQKQLRVLVLQSGKQREKVITNSVQALLLYQLFAANFLLQTHHFSKSLKTNFALSTCIFRK